MAAPKGHARYGGRTKGTPNKATANARQAIGDFIDGNIDRLQKWLDEIATEDGARAAMACFIDLIEYHVPKLGRVELTGEDGGALQVRIVRFSDTTAEQLDSAALSAASLEGSGTGLPPRRTAVAPPKRQG